VQGVRENERRAVIVLTLLEMRSRDRLSSAAGTRNSGPVAFGANRIVPSACQAPPRGT
jgi:hypothetical protein